jgi:hypothetical protein
MYDAESGLQSPWTFTTPDKHKTFNEDEETLSLDVLKSKYTASAFFNNTRKFTL